MVFLSYKILTNPPRSNAGGFGFDGDRDFFGVSLCSTRSHLGVTWGTFGTHSGHIRDVLPSYPPLIECLTQGGCGWVRWVSRVRMQTVGYDFKTPIVVRILEGAQKKTWVDKIPLLFRNLSTHEPI